MARINYKVGQRHSKTDQEHLDMALNHVVQAGAVMPAPPTTPDAQRVADANAEASTANKRVRYAGTKSVNLTELIEGVCDAWHDLFEVPEGMIQVVPIDSPCIETIFDDHIIICTNEGDYYSVAYTVDAQGVYAFVPQDQWLEVEVSYVPAQETPEPGDAMMSISIPGKPIKALGNGKIGGYLVVFGTPDQTDMEREFFTKDTQFGSHSTSLVFYHHGLDGAMKRTILDDAATLKTDEMGVWIEAQLKMRDDYEKFLYAQAESGKAGWSSGTAAHLVEREPRGKAMWIKSWPLGLDASITLTPAEPRARALPIKSLPASQSLQALLQASGEDVNAVKAKAQGSNSAGDNTMPVETQTADLVAAVKENTEALKALLAKPGAQIESKSGFAGVQATDVKDVRPFKSFGEQLHAIVKASDKNNPEVDRRLYEVKAPSGLNETVTSDGGFLVQTDFSTALLERMYETNAILDKCSPITVSGGANGTKINAFDETSRVDGSRWGGVQAYWAAEAAQFTGKKPTFRQIELTLKKLTGLCYATDENLQDAAQLESIIMRVFPLEFGFKVEDSVINGGGAGIPLGILNSSALVSVAKEVGQTAATIVSSNVIKMWARLWNRSMQNAVWLVNQDALPQLYTMTVTAGLGGVPVFLPPSGVSAQPYAMIFGRPVIPVEYCQTVGTVGDIILADFNEYLIARKGGIQSASSIHLRFDYDETVFRFTLRLDGQPAWNSALTPKNGSNTLSPFIALATRA